MITLYYHPLASYCWKVLIALYELGAPFEKRLIDLGDPAHRAELAALWPPCKFPVLRVEGRAIAESSIIVEYLDRRCAGARSLFGEGEAALEARLWDRIFDHYVQTPMQEIVLDRIRGGGGDVSGAHRTLTMAYEMADQRLAASSWIAGDEFGAADCAAAPALFYASTLQPFPSHCARLGAYFERLMDRPSVRRTIEEASPYFKDYPFASAIPRRFLAQP